MRQSTKKGFIVLTGVMLSLIILTITVGVLEISFKEVTFSSIGRNTNEASFAADVGVECALYHDKTSIDSFSLADSGEDINCANTSINPSYTGDGVTTGTYTFTVANMNSAGQCARVTVQKDNSTPPMTTTITSKGYNIGDGSCNSTNPNRVERVFLASVNGTSGGGGGPPPPPPANSTLTVALAGTGSGSVSSSPAGISCGSDCTEDYADSTSVTLTPTPGGGSVFGGWTGDADCGDGSVTMSGSRSCTATFNLQSVTFPTVAGTNSGFQNVDTTTHTINLPSSITAGDLLIVVVEFDGNPTISGWPAGWTQMFVDSASTTDKFEGRYKIATGGETSFNLSTGVASEQSAHQSFRITGYTGLPQWSTAKDTTATLPPNSPNLSPSWGGSPGTLWISAVGRGSGVVTTNSYPSGYTNTITTQTGTAAVGGTVDSARRNLAAASEDPGNYTVSSVQYWVAATIAIQGI